MASVKEFKKNDDEEANCFNKQLLEGAFGGNVCTTIRHHREGVRGRSGSLGENHETQGEQQYRAFSKCTDRTVQTIVPSTGGVPETSMGHRSAVNIRCTE